MARASMAIMGRSSAGPDLAPGAGQLRGLDPQPSTWRVAFAGGGTGGHLAPGLALLEAAGPVGFEELVWFLAGRPIEDRVLARVEDRLVRRVSLGLERGAAPRTHQLVLRAAPAIRRARMELRRSGCELLLALGGAVTLPAVLAARSLRLPVVLLEANAVAGRATRSLERFAALVCHATDSSKPSGNPTRARHVVTGLPVQDLSVGEEQVARWREAQGLEAGKPLLLVLGGSQGARGLNRFVQEQARGFSEAGIQVVHQVGPERLEEAADRTLPGYRAVEYLDPLAPALSAADFCLCRGGSGTLSELMAVRLPAMVVPYPHHRDGHQAANALAHGPAFEIVAEAELSPKVAERLRDLVADRHGESSLRRAAGEVPAGLRASEIVLRELAKLIAQRRSQVR